MSIIRIGSTEKYSDGWAAAFGKKKAKSASASTKKAKPKKAKKKTRKK